MNPAESYPSAGLSIPRDKRCSASTLLALLDSHTGLKAVALIKQGNLNVHMKFRVALPETVVVFAMLIYDNVIEITNNRDVIFNFAP